MNVRRGGDIAWVGMTVVVVVLVRLDLGLGRVSTGRSGDARGRGGVDGETETELGGERRGKRRRRGEEGAKSGGNAGVAEETSGQHRW